MNHVVRYLRKVALCEGADSLTDGQLLETFLTTRDEAAFEILLRRHGPMVLGVCRRTLRNAHDAEDAFQATFLVLVRKASTIRPREMVGNWLYGVACRTALKARAMSMKRRIKERAAPGAAQHEDVPDKVQDDLLQHLDAEVNRLPDKYRIPVVLCELQGKSRKEAARLLGLSEGTLSWRLAWARKILAHRLSSRSLPLSAGAVSAALSSGTASAGLPPTLLHLTARAALQAAAGRTLTAGAVSAQVVALTEGVLKAMLLSKLKVLWPVVLIASIGAGATGLAYRATAADPAQPGDAPRQVRLALNELEELRLEVAALRKGLDATRERVKSLEGEVGTLKQQRPRFIGALEGASSFGGSALGFSGGGMGFAGGKGSGFSGSSLGFGGSVGAGLPPSRSPGASGSSGEEQPNRPGKQPQAGKSRASEDPLADAEKAIKELRQHPDNKQAADQLERTLRWLKQRPKAKEGSAN